MATALPTAPTAPEKSAAALSTSATERISTSASITTKTLSYSITSGTSAGVSWTSTVTLPTPQITTITSFINVMVTISPTGTTTTKPTSPLSSTSSLTPGTTNPETPAVTTSLITKTGVSTISNHTTTHSEGPIPTGSAANSTPFSKEVSHGAAAGIGVGSALGGLLIGALVTFFLLMGRRNRRPSRRPEAEVGTSNASHGHGDGVFYQSDKPLISKSLSDFLPESASDDALRHKFNDISERIAHHVENYYNNSTAAVQNVAQLPLVTQISNSNNLNLEALLAEPSARPAAIRRIILQRILSAIDPKQNSDRTLLPPNIPYIAAKMKQGSTDTKIYQNAFSTWRSLTAFLLQLDRGRTGDYDAYLNTAIKLNLDDINAIIAPYADPKVDITTRNSSLSNSMKKAAEFGVTLFSQRSTWIYAWGKGVNSELAVGGRRSLTVRPALVRITDEDGKLLEQPVVALEAEEEYW